MQRTWGECVAVVEDAVGGGQVEQADFAAAQGQGQPVAFGKGGNACLAGELAEGLDADLLQHLDSRHVVAVGEGCAQADRPVGFAVVILGAIGGLCPVAVLHGESFGQVRQDGRCGQGGGRAAPLRVERSGVGEGFDGAAGLASGQRGVEIAAGIRSKIVWAADQGQDVAVVAVEDDGGCAVDLPAACSGVAAGAFGLAGELGQPPA